MNDKQIIIKKWKDLDGLENDEYKINVRDNGDRGAYIRHKTNRRDKLYLSTHFFYKSINNPNDRSMETLIRDKFGFNLEVVRY